DRRLLVLGANHIGNRSVVGDETSERRGNGRLVRHGDAASRDAPPSGGQERPGGALRHAQLPDRTARAAELPRRTSARLPFAAQRGGGDQESLRALLLTIDQSDDRIGAALSSDAHRAPRVTLEDFNLSAVRDRRQRDSSRADQPDDRAQELSLQR